VGERIYASLKFLLALLLLATAASVHRSRDATLHDDQEMSRSQAPRVFTSSDVSLASASLVDEVDSRNDHARDDHLA